MKDAVLEMQESPSGRQVDIFKPKAYAVLLNLALVLNPVWHRVMFKNISSFKLLEKDSFLKVVSVFFPEEFKQIEDDLGSFCSALDYQQLFEANQGSDAFTRGNFLGLVVNQAAGFSQNTKQAINTNFSIGNFLHEPAKLVYLSKDAQTERTAALSAAEIMGLFSNLTSNEMLLKNLDYVSQNLLVTQYIEDFIDSPAEVTQLKQIFFKFIEWLILEGNGLPQVLLGSQIVSPGEIDVFRDIIALKEVITKRGQKAKDARAKGVPPSTVPSIVTSNDVIERIIASLLRKSSFLSVDFLAEVFPMLLDVDKLDSYVELLVKRLSWLNQEKAGIIAQIENSKKILVQTQDTASGDATLNQNWFHFSAAESDRLEKNKLSLNRVESEARRIFTQIVSLLYDVSGVEQREVEVIKLPDFLRNIRWISWLWDMIYCNKKTVIARVSLSELKETCPEKLSRVQAYMADRKADTYPILLSLLKKILSSSNEELRKSIMMWLINEGKVALVEDIDPEMTDDYLTTSLCSIIKSEGLLSGMEAANNHRFLIKNMTNRKQFGPALKLIQDLLDNGLLTADHGASMIEISNCLLGEDPEKRLFNLDSISLGELRAAALQLPVVSLRERAEYIQQAFDLLKEAQPQQLGAEKYKLNRYFEDRKQICEEQMALLNEVSLLDFRLTKILETVQRLGNPADPLCASVFTEPHLFVQRDYPRVLTNLQRKLAQIKFVGILLNIKLWNSEVTFNRLVVPLELHKYIALRAINDQKLSHSSRFDCLRKSIKNLIELNSRTQTLSDVIYLVDDDSRDRVREVAFYTEVVNPASRELLIQFMKNEVIWPINVKNQLTTIIKEIGLVESLHIPEKREICTMFMKQSEVINNMNPYMALLLSNADEYLQTDAVGIVKMASERQFAAPFLEIYYPLSIVWTGDLLASCSSVVLKSFGPALGVCNEIYLDYIAIYNELQARIKNFGRSEELDNEGDMLAYNFLRYLIYKADSSWSIPE